MKRKKKFYTDEKLDETIEMVDGHLENIFDEIGKILGFNINTEMNELILGLINKTNQKLELNEEKNIRLLQRSFTTRLKYMLWKNFFIEICKMILIRIGKFLRITNGE